MSLESTILKKIIELQKNNEKKDIKELLSKLINQEDEFQQKDFYDTTINILKQMLEEEDSNSDMDKLLNNHIKTFKTFNSIVGLEEVKNYARTEFINPNDERFLSLNSQTEAGTLLLYGPPGTGKTITATYIIGEYLKDFKNIYHDEKNDTVTFRNDIPLYFWSLESSQFRSKYVGDTEKNLNYFFKKIINDAKKHEDKKYVIFMDEIDSLVKDRKTAPEYEKNVVTAFIVLLTELSKYKNIFFFAATNLIWDLDSAFISRMKKQVYVRLPDDNERVEMLKKFLNDNDNDYDDRFKQHYIQKTKDLSGRDLDSLFSNIKSKSKNEYFKSEYFREGLKIWKKNGIQIKSTYVPCKEYEVGSIKREEFFNKYKNKYNTLFSPMITMKSIIEALDEVIVTIKKEDLLKNMEYDKLRRGVKENKDELDKKKEDVKNQSLEYINLKIQSVELSNEMNKGVIEILMKEREKIKNAFEKQEEFSLKSNSLLQTIINFFS